MTTNEIILKAQLASIRRTADVLLRSLWADVENKPQLLWYARYLNYKFERDSLSPCCFGLTEPVAQPELLEHRRYHLQVLMDVAYIQGSLGELGIVRRISPPAAALAEKVFRHYDGFDESLFQALEKIDGDSLP